MLTDFGLFVQWNMTRNNRDEVWKRTKFQKTGKQRKDLPYKHMSVVTHS